MKSGWIYDVVIPIVVEVIVKFKHRVNFIILYYIIYMYLGVLIYTCVLQLIMGMCRFGFVTIYLSDPLTRALTTGAGVHVFTSQIRHIFGIKTGRFNGPLKLVYVSQLNLRLRVLQSNLRLFWNFNLLNSVPKSRFVGSMFWKSYLHPHW